MIMIMPIPSWRTYKVHQPIFREWCMMYCWALTIYCSPALLNYFKHSVYMTKTSFGYSFGHGQNGKHGPEDHDINTRQFATFMLTIGFHVYYTPRFWSSWLFFFSSGVVCGQFSPLCADDQLTCQNHTLDNWDITSVWIWRRPQTWTALAEPW